MEQFRSLVQEDPLEAGMTTHASVLAWRLPFLLFFFLPLSRILFADISINATCTAILSPWFAEIWWKCYSRELGFRKIRQVARFVPRADMCSWSPASDALLSYVTRMPTAGGGGPFAVTRRRLPLCPSDADGAAWSSRVCFGMTAPGFQGVPGHHCGLIVHAARVTETLSSS